MKNASMNIQLVKHEDLDKQKWDSCVHYATRGNVYGYWWYLTNTVKEWDALVEGDYESVFPLFPLDSQILTTPDTIKEIGIYSINVLSMARVKAFLEAIPASYQQYSFTLNAGINWPTDSAIKPSTVYNHQLLLNTDYESLEKNYTPRVEAQMDLARDNRLILNSNLKPEKVADFYRIHTKDHTIGINYNFHAYQRIMYNALHRGNGFASGVMTDKEEYLACGFFIFSHGKILRLISNVSLRGIKMGANTLLFDMLIRGNAGRPVLLDFNSFNEKSFAKDFGAVTVPHYRVESGLGS